MDNTKQPGKPNYNLSLIKKNHVLSAIKDINKNGIPPNAHSSTYDLIYKGKPYPPKLVLSWAYQQATGTELERKLFEGGLNTPCFNTLEKLGFTIIPKSSQMELLYRKEVDYSTLIEGITILTDMLPKFIEILGDVKPGNKKKIIIKIDGKDYQAEFRHINKRTGPNVYQILYPRKGIVSSHLISLYPEACRILEEERAKSGGKKVYAKLPADKKEYLYIYYDNKNKKLIWQNKPMIGVPVPNLPIDDITQQPFTLSRTSDIRRTGLLFNPDLIHRYAISLLTKPFVILSGLSGSGKTKLALSFAKWLTGKSEQVKIISVGADWNNREYLLGYPNALHEKQYVKPDNGVLDFIIRASNDPEMPYFLILDEMNLSYVERYFADFLSTMESRQPITLHPGPGVWDDEIPPTLTLPKNLYITGTINVDETTYMFSPKVLDRANVIEFRITAEEMTTFLAECKPLDADAADHLGASMQKDFVERSKSNNLESDPGTNKILLDFFTALKKAGAEFGYRTASEIYRYITIAKELEVSDGSDEEEEKRKNHRIDVVIMQKLLPKLHGSRKKIQPILQTLWNLCQKKGDKTTIEKEDIRFDEQFIYPLSAAKIWQMNKNAKDNGFTSYAEA